MKTNIGRDVDGMIDEAAPLLGGAAIKASNTESPIDQDGRPGPDSQPATAKQPPTGVTQILLLCGVAIVQPMVFGSILPFINQMVHDTGNLSESDVGFWSGLIESLFAIAQMSVLVLYARVANRIGRKPVLVFSLVALGTACILFGLVTNLTQILAVRCLAGLVSGDAVITRIMLTERCGKADEARAFSWYGVSGNVGLLLGPIIGGLFARPANLYPASFGQLQFFHDHPFALPNMVTGGLCFIAALVTFMFIKETIAHKHDSTETEPQKVMSTWELLKSPGVLIVLIIFGHVMTQGISMGALLPLILFTSIEKGGFGFSEQLIAITLIVIGSSQTIAMLLLFPPLHQRFGTGRILKVCAASWPIFTATFPVFHIFLRNGWRVLFWSSAGVFWTLGPAGAMIFACVQLCINDISPSPQVVATINALAMTINSASRAVVPILFTSLFATGVRLQWASGQLAFIVLTIFSCTLPLLLFWLPKKADPQSTSNEQDDEREE